MWLGKHFPDLRAYNVALSACESSGRWRQARPIFVRFEADFIRFQALLLLKLMKKRRLRPDEVRFNCMEPFVRNRRSRWPRWGRPARGAVWPGFSAWRSTCRLVLEGFWMVLGTFGVVGAGRRAQAQPIVVSSLKVRPDATLLTTTLSAYELGRLWQAAAKHLDVARTKLLRSKRAPNWG